jgi:hypothetical protein
MFLGAVTVPFHVPKPGLATSVLNALPRSAGQQEGSYVVEMVLVEMLNASPRNRNVNRSVM